MFYWNHDNECVNELGMFYWNHDNECVNESGMFQWMNETSETMLMNLTMNMLMNE